MTHIVFVCEHGAAKSIVAATYFNKLAREKGLNIKAVARGTHPDQELSQTAITGLLEDGLTPLESIPIKLLATDLETAQQIITFCELPAEYRLKVPVEQWDDTPPVSENYQAARAVILEHLDRLIAELN